MKAIRTALIVALTACALASADDAAKVFSVSTDGTTQKVAAGKQGTLVIAFHTDQAAHISNEAPLKISLSGKNLSPAKPVLHYADSVAKPDPSKQYPDPRFEVPFTATAKGQGTIDAKMTFFVCTEQLCSRHQQTISVPVEVE